MKNTVVVDLDGTLADGRARYHLIAGKKRDYAAFHARLMEDPVNEWCRDLVRGLAALGKRVAMVSARPRSVVHEGAVVDVLGLTRAWLDKREVPYHDLFLLRGDLRGDEDNIADHELKRAWVRSYGKDRVLFTVEDRKRVAAMWREEGLTCLHCADWPGDVG